MLADRRYRSGDPKSPSGFLADMVFWVDHFPRSLERPGPAARNRPQAPAAGSRRSGISVWVFDTDLISRARHAAKGRAECCPNHPTGVHPFDFGFGGGARRGNSPDRSGHLSTDVVTSSLNRTDDLRSDPSREARAFQSWSRPSLEYGEVVRPLRSKLQPVCSATSKMRKNGCARIAGTNQK